ncbi:hypothetical protein WN51_09272 [Melipona quadrifasciata]|uniref:Uncharacterized protein n=1 Tax=Melipona quadrifasciata TaxID=166423 RepID=A0A0M9A5F4_9HYME|nr:hypothetical protein WN51_09272 [Melipona quadrifasciata]
MAELSEEFAPGSFNSTGRKKAAYSQSGITFSSGGSLNPIGYRCRADLDNNGSNGNRPKRNERKGSKFLDENSRLDQVQVGQDNHEVLDSIDPSIDKGKVLGTSMAGYSSTHSGAPRPEICTAPFQAPSFAEYPWSLARACCPYAVCKQLIYTRFSAARLRENRYFPDAWSIASSITDVTVCRVCIPRFGGSDDFKFNRNQSPSRVQLILKRTNLTIHTVELKKKTIQLSKSGDQTFCGDQTFREHELGTFGSLEFLTVKSIVDNFRSAVLNSEL